MSEKISKDEKLEALFNHKPDIISYRLNDTKEITHAPIINCYTIQDINNRISTIEGLSNFSGWQASSLNYINNFKSTYNGKN